MNVIEVVAGALFDETGRVLIAQRPLGKSSAGRWEFPGGKRESGESHLAALARELFEELGITVVTEHCEPLMQLEHRQDDRCIQLHFFAVRAWRGELTAREGQDLLWRSPDELSDCDILEADQPFILFLQELSRAMNGGKVVEG